VLLSAPQRAIQLQFRRFKRLNRLDVQDRHGSSKAASESLQSQFLKAGKPNSKMKKPSHDRLGLHP
jgi:hypothetical protein